jgi:hypothetical protein
MMNLNTLPAISTKELAAVADNAAEFIILFTGHYHKILSSHASGQAQGEFTTEQNILLAFDVLDGQVSNGGFIQLIENGYGAYVFDTPLSDHLRSWGLMQAADIIDKARILYEPKKEILEKEKTLAEFAKLYQEHPEFEPLDNEYYKIADAQREAMKSYILAHINSFAQIV